LPDRIKRETLHRKACRWCGMYAKIDSISVLSTAISKADFLVLIRFPDMIDGALAEINTLVHAAPPACFVV